MFFPCLCGFPPATLVFNNPKTSRVGYWGEEEAEVVGVGGVVWDISACAYRNMIFLFNLYVYKVG